MARYDLKRLRSDHKITQKELADKLNITQGFLSSVEKWRNPFPDERVSDLQAVFPDIDLSDYEVPEEDVPKNNVGCFNRHSDIDINDSKLLSKIIELIGTSSTRDEKEMEGENAEINCLRSRIDKLNATIDSLREECESLRKEKYEYREEIFNLRELLLSNGIDYKEKKSKK